MWASSVTPSHSWAVSSSALEVLALDVEHDAAVHGDEAAVGVEGEALVAGLLGEALDASRR